MITGDTRRPREEWVSPFLGAGLAHGGVTRSTRVLVAADPDSESGKAQKARSYGIPVITEAAFEQIYAAYRRESASGS